MSNYQKNSGTNNYNNSYSNGNGNWNNQNNQRPNQGTNKMNPNPQTQNKNNQNETKTAKTNINYNGNGGNSNAYHQKNQGYQQQNRYNNGYGNGGAHHTNHYNNNRNNQQYYNNFNNIQQQQQYQMWMQQQQQTNQAGNFGYNNMMMFPNGGSDVMQMWDMNALQQANLLDVNSQNFPSLGAQLPPVYAAGFGADNGAETAETIPDSSEFERRLLEEQIKQQNSNGNATAAKPQVSQITDVNMLFTQMNILTNGLDTGDNQDNKMMVRTKQGVFLIDYNMNSILDESTKISPWNQYSFFIQDGHYVICADSSNIGVFSTTKKKLLDHKKLNEIQDLKLSPLQKYLVCIEKPDHNSDDIKLQILDALSLQMHKELDYNFFSKSRMNLYLFDKNENQIFIREKKEIQIYNTSNFELVTTVNAENFIYQYLSPSQDQQQLLLLTPEFSKGYEMIPAQVMLFNLSDLNNSVLDINISKSQEVIPIWSPNGKHLLLWCSTIKDDTGNTYYGQHTIYRYKPETKSIEAVNFYKGVIHDIQWQPNSEHFVVIGGGMPSHSVLFNKDGVPLFEFGRHHINKVKWSPYSKLLFLGGFGNLGGDIEVWNLQEFKKIGSFKAHCTVSSCWNFDGTKILCGVLFPKLRVQNNFKVFDVYGNLCKYADYSSTDLYEVAWHPYPFPEEKALPEKRSPNGTQSESDTNSNAESKNGDEKPKKGILTKRGNLSSMLNENKISNHGGKFLQPEETFAREEDKEMEQVKQSTTQKKQDQGIMFSRNKNKFIDQPKPLSEDEERALEREKKLQKQQQKKSLKLPSNNNSGDSKTFNNNPQINNIKNQSDNNSGRGSSNGGRTSPELDDFFNETDEVNDQDRLNMQAIIKKNDQ